MPPANPERFTVNRADLSGQQTTLNVWHLQGKKIDNHAMALAYGILERLAQQDDWRVEDDGKSRPLAPGDIAILCATNSRRLSLSTALARFGLDLAPKLYPVLSSLRRVDLPCWAG